MELVSAAREYETREADPSLGGFVDRLSLLSEADEAEGAQEARVWLMTHARGQGPRVPDRRRRRHGRRPVPALALASEDEDEVEEERRLCYVCLTRARERLVLTGAARRRIFGDYQSTEPSRFLDEIPAELDRSHRAGGVRAAMAAGGYELRNPYGRRYGRGTRVREGDASRDVRVRERRPVSVAACAPACACAINSSASAPSSTSRSRATTSKSRCGSRRSARRSCWRASRGSSRRDAWRPVSDCRG